MPIAAFGAAADNPSTAIETVVIQGQKLNVETKIDRKIYTVPEDAQSTLGTLSDILSGRLRRPRSLSARARSVAGRTFRGL